MTKRTEPAAFAVVLLCAVVGFFHESLLGGKVLSSADVLLATASFGEPGAAEYEPANRLLMDPALQFEPWLEFNRRLIRSGRLPLWNSRAGCGVPHLANGQSAVFDPFQLVAYLGDAAAARGVMAALRLWTAGMGIFLLARKWGLGRWGRWFAGMTFPFSGFLVVWLLFPVAWSAVWTPWLVLAIDRLLDHPSTRRAAGVALATALVIAGGHIQTSAHVLVLGGLYAIWRVMYGNGKGIIAVGLGFGLGLMIAAAQVIPLAGYLGQSSVWRDREVERPAWWRLAPPRLLDAARLAAPYIYGGQRRGQPNLGRALGAQNLNESAGGCAGLATLIWLAPLALVRPRRSAHAAFLAGLAVFGFLGAFGLPPVDNLLRAIPVLQVTDNRRLTLYLAFALPLLGGLGLDRLEDSAVLPRSWIAAWAAAAVAFLGLALAVQFSEPWIKARIARANESATEDIVARDQRVESQTRRVVAFMPRYYGFVAAELAGLTGLVLLCQRRQSLAISIRPVVFAGVLLDLAVLGLGYNPAIPRTTYDYEPAVVERLKERLAPGARAIGLSPELPPNVLMRFGLADARDYDSIELERAVTFFDRLYEPGSSAAPSRREITWAGAARARETLEQAGVAAVVWSSRPPGAFARVEQVGRVWIAWLDARPYATLGSGRAPAKVEIDDGAITIELASDQPEYVLINETWDSGWSATIDGRPGPLFAPAGLFMASRVPAGRHVLVLRYTPWDVLVGLGTSALALAITILLLTRNRLF